MKNKFKIYDTVYKEIQIVEPVFQKLIFTSEFQRLKNIHQLGLLTFVRSSSRHTRYSHSLGVYWLLTILFNRSSFDKVSEKDKLEIKAAGLLHDIGHGPFSHNFEQILPKFIHEEYSVKIIRNSSGSIFPLLKKYNLDIDRICNLITGKTKNDWGQTLISGQFDFDRLDYMIRDQHFAGSGMKLTNQHNLLENIFLKDNKIIFAESAVKHVESYLIFRFYLYQQLFWNRKSLLLEKALKTIFQRIRHLIEKQQKLELDYSLFDFLIQEKLPTVKQFLYFDDSDIFNLIKKIYYQETDPILKKMSGLFINPKKHYDDYVTTDRNIIAKLPDKNYFIYEKKQKIIIYDPNEPEILFLKENGEIDKLSNLSIFFEKLKKYERKVLFYLDFSQD